MRAGQYKVQDSVLVLDKAQIMATKRKISMEKATSYPSDMFKAYITSDFVCNFPWLDGERLTIYERIRLQSTSMLRKLLKTGSRSLAFTSAPTPT